MLTHAFLDCIMSRRKRNAAFIIATLFIVGPLLAGCAPSASDNLSDIKKRQAIMSNAKLTMDEREEQLSHLDDSDAPSPFVPIGIALALGVVCYCGYIVKKGVQKKQEELLRERKRQEKIATYKAALVARGMNPAIAEEPEPGAPGSTAAPEPPPPPRFKSPASQAAVDEIETDERGVSFFTSRPFPNESLVQVKLKINGVSQIVWANPDEADAIKAGAVPLVRAFTLKRKTLPWYEWKGYYPYDHYWGAAKADWQWVGGKLTASWLRLGDIDPVMPGYNGSGPTEKMNWDRVTRTVRKHGDNRLLAKCKDLEKFLEMKRRKRLPANRPLSRGRNKPPLAIPRRPLKLHKRLIRAPINSRLTYLEF